jgi:hypothetical protein
MVETIWRKGEKESGGKRLAPAPPAKFILRRDGRAAAQFGWAGNKSH